VRSWPRRGELVLDDDAAMGCLQQHYMDQRNFKKVKEKKNSTIGKASFAYCVDVELREGV